jgi:hypothetical protein
VDRDGSGFFGTKRVLVPVQTAASHEDGLMVPYSKDHVKKRPEVDEDGISQQTEGDLAAYYEVGYSQEQSQTGVTDGGKHATGKATGTGRKQESVTRSEEEHVVTKLAVPRERVIIRKETVTEFETVEAELPREHISFDTSDVPEGSSTDDQA